MALQTFVGPWPVFFSFVILYTIGRAPWTSDKPVARPLPIHRTTQTHTQTSMPRVGFEPTIPASEDSSRLTLRGHRDRRLSITFFYYITYSEVYFGAVLVAPSLLSQRILMGKQVPSCVSIIKAHRLEVTVLGRGRGK
jgi:hypothetical protein